MFRQGLGAQRGDGSWAQNISLLSQSCGFSIKWKIPLETSGQRHGEGRAKQSRVGNPTTPLATVLPHPAACSAGAVSRPCLWRPGLIGISSRLLAGLVSGPGRAWASCLPGCERMSTWAWGTGVACECHACVHHECVSQLLCVSTSTRTSAHSNRHTEEVLPQICP